jgi:hypothetical protein
VADDAEVGAGALDGGLEEREAEREEREHDGGGYSRGARGGPEPGAAAERELGG